MTLLEKTEKRLIIYPQKDIDLWAMYKQHVASFWSSEELDLASDLTDWAYLSDDERHFIKTVLAFFAAADGIVNENLAINFYKEVQSSEARAFYSFQIAMETIHSETYSLLIETYIQNSTERNELFNAINDLQVIKDKAEWSLKWMDESKSFDQRLVAFSCVEGVLFSGSFCAIFWLKKRGLMPGLTFSNELISRDEGLHTDFACLLFKKIGSNLDETIVHNIIREAVEIEERYICYAIPCSLIGINADSMKKYIQFVADRLAVSLGYSKIYKSVNPFDWMELISLQGKTNFFEKRVGEYQKSGVMASLNGNSTSFSLSEDF